MNNAAKVYLIPAFLDEDAMQVLPGYILEAVKECQVFFVENERSARRYLKSLWKEMIIDQYEWYPIHKAEEKARSIFNQKLKEGKTIGIISEAGCPGIADPGQILVEAAQDAKITVKPLVGPSSILLSLMASGMNGQHFRFVGYLSIEAQERINRIRELENISAKENCTQIFIETPYRNNQMIETILNSCKPQTRLCIAVNVTGKEESIVTRNIKDWKNQVPNINKKPAIFLLQG